MPEQANTSVDTHLVEQFKPNVTVAAIVVAKNRFLIVEERENDRTVFNQPAGHIEAHENLVNACKRELLEETGLALTPQYCSGVYYFHRPELNLYFLRFAFVIELNDILIAEPQDSDIITTHWLTLEEIHGKASQLRSTMVLDCIYDYLAGNKFDLSLLKTNL